MRFVSQAYSILAQNSAQRLKWKVFGRALDNQTHLFVVSESNNIGKMQLPVMFPRDIVNAKNLSSTRQ